MAALEFVVGLVDNMSKPAKSAADQVKGLATSMTETQRQAKVLQGALDATRNSMQLAMARGDADSFWKLAGASNGYKDALDKLRPQLDKDNTAAGVATQKHEALQRQMQANAASSEEMAAGLEVVSGALAAAAAAAVAVVGVFGALIYQGAKFAIASSEAKSQMLAMFDAMGEGKISGDDVDNMLDDMRAHLGITKDAMVPLVKQFMSMGVISKDAIERMTTAALSAKALVGGAESGAQAFAELSKKIQVAAETGQGLKIPLKGLGSLADMGLTVDDVAKKMGVSASALASQLKTGSADAKRFGDALQDALIAKGAGPLNKLSMSLGNVWDMFKEFIGDLFEDLQPAIAPFLAQVKSLFGIFDSKAQPSGQALKAGIEGFFKRVFEVATKVVPLVKHFLLDMIIYGLKAYIALKPIVKWFQDLKNNEKFMTFLRLAMKGIAQAAISLGVAIGVVLAVFIALQAAVAVIAGAFYVLTAVIAGFVSDAIKKLVDWVGITPKMALDFVTGLVNGILNGGGQIVQAVTGLATKAKDAFKSALGIHSPSQVMMQLGGHVAGGVAEGMQARAPEVHSASGELAKAAAGGMSASTGTGATGGASGQTGVNVTVEPGAIVVQGGGDRSALELTESAIALLFERVALAQGL